MSVVTNVVVLVREHDDAVDEYLASPHGAPERLDALACVSVGPAAEQWGGTKHPEADVWAGAFNYLDIDAFLDWLRGCPFERPELVVVAISEQHDGAWRVLGPDEWPG